MALFERGTFTSAAGLTLHWKIECDSLSPEDWETIAFASAPHLAPFGDVKGVPTGGERLVAPFRPYITEGPTLIVDDVWTTGKSMTNCAREHGIVDWRGFVAFARGPLLPGVICFMRTEF